MYPIMKSSIFRLSFVLLGASALVLYAATGPESKTPALRIDASSVGERGGTGVVTSYAEVVESAQATVVSVYSTKRVRQRVPTNPMLRQFFPNMPEQESEQQGMGSGVIVSADGYILTNNHVIAGADELRVALPDGREFDAKLVGADDKTDVAVIKIAEADLPFATLADSDKLRVGDVVFAVGNPLGIGQTVTMGIVSAKGRNNLGLLDDGAGYEDFIQTDASINMGNSGGALIDARGRLVGINTAILSNNRGNIGIGFSIPINLAASIMNSLVATGSVQRGFLGVQVDSVTAESRELHGLKPGQSGVVIANVTPGGPADKAGLQRNDVILSIKGRAVTSVQDLRLVVSQILPGTPAVVRIVRGGKEETIDVELGTLADASGRPTQLLEGVEVARIMEETRRQFNVPMEVDGLVITAIAPDSPFARRLVPGMVIVDVNREPVTDLAAAKALLKRGERHLLLVYFRGVYRYLPVDLP